MYTLGLLKKIYFLEVFRKRKNWLEKDERYTFHPGV